MRQRHLTTNLIMCRCTNKHAGLLRYLPVYSAFILLLAASANNTPVFAAKCEGYKDQVWRKYCASPETQFDNIIKKPVESNYFLTAIKK